MEKRYEETTRDPVLSRPPWTRRPEDGQEERSQLRQAVLVLREGGG